jgi:hypothetical protein
MAQRDDFGLHSGLAAKPDEKGIEHYSYKVEHGSGKGNNVTSASSTFARKMRFQQGQTLADFIQFIKA